MQTKPILAAALGAAIAAGAITAANLGTGQADAQSGGAVTQADLNAANQRSIRAIKQGTSVWNSLGKYLAPKGTLISVSTPRISQQAGTGDGGLPTSAIKNGAITSTKLSSGVQAQLNTIYTAAVLNTPGQEPSLTRGKGATAVTRTTGIGTGAFDVAFGTNNISSCTWTASIGTTQPGALTPVFAPFSTYATLLDNTTLRVFTFKNSPEALADAPFQVHVIC
jgi:hypothetical protein